MIRQTAVSSVPPSSPVLPQASSLSQRILAIHWDEHAPFTVGDGVVMEPASLEESLAFIRDHYGRIFGSDPGDARFFTEPATPAKARFLAESDRFVFREGDEAIGLLVGNPVDWSTYYWRSVAFLPEHQGRGLLAAALEHTDPILRDAGVVRVEGEAAPINYRQVRLLMRLGYCVTGSTNSERWGTLLRLTKFLRPEAGERFVNQFCRDTHLASHAPRSITKEGAYHEEVCTRNALSSRVSSARSLRDSGVFTRRRS